MTNIVLIETIEIPLGLMFAWLLLREKSDLSAVIGACVALVGVGITMALQMGEGAVAMVGSGGVSGELLAVFAVTVFVIGSVISKRQLRSIPVGVFAVVRNLVGTIIFIVIVVYFFGLEHFADLFSPLLWKWMLLYGGVVVVCGQICWFKGIGSVKPQDIAIASAASPVVGVAFAALILGERPSAAQWIGGSIILVGIGIGLFGTRLWRSQDKAKAFTGI